MADVTVTLTVDKAEYDRQLMAAEGRLQQFSNRAGTHARAASRASGAGMGRMAGDALNILGGTSGSVMRINALEHLVGGVGVATGIAALSVLAEKWTEAADKSLKYREELEKIERASHATGTFKAAEQINQEFDAAIEKLDELHRSRVGENAGGARALGITARRMGNMLLGEGTPEEQKIQEGKDREETRQAALKSIEQLARKQMDLNSVESERIHISERQAALDEEEIRHRERLGALAAMEAKVPGSNGNLLAAENERNRLAREAIERKANLADETTSIRRRVQSGSMTSAAGRLAQLRARREASSDREREDVDLDINEEQFNQFQQMTGSNGAAYRAAQRREARARANFNANKRDYEDRAKGGAYGQTGVTADIFGARDTPEKGPGADNLTGKLDTLITTLTNLPAQIGIA